MNATLKASALLRSVTEHLPHCWCGEYGWHNEGECPAEQELTTH